MKGIAPPDFAEKPAWYEKQLEEEQAAANESQQAANDSAGNGRAVTYTVSTKGATSADLGEFAAQVNETQVRAAIDEITKAGGIFWENDRGESGSVLCDVPRLLQW